MTSFATFEQRAVWLMELLLKDFPQWGIDDAAADAGNAGAESLIQMVQEAGQVPPNGGFGLFQWTGPRRLNFTAYCARTGRDTNAMQSGYDFHFVELKGDFAKVIGEVAAAKTLSDKVAAFEQHYEMAGVVRMDARLQFAERAKAAYLTAHPMPVQPVPVPPPVALPKPVPLPIPPNPSAPDDPGVPAPKPPSAPVPVTPPPTKGPPMFPLGFMLKAVVSFLMPGVVATLAPILAGLGVNGTMDWETGLTMVLTGLVTYAVPGFGKTIAGFVVPPIVAAVAGAIKGVGITGSMNWTTVLTMLVTGLLTHFVPNMTAPAPAAKS